MMVIKKLAVCLLILSLLLTGCNNPKEKDTADVPSKQEETVVDDGYSILHKKSITIDQLRDNSANRDPVILKDATIKVYGKELPITFDEKLNSKFLKIYEFYEKYCYDCIDEDIDLTYTSQGNLIRFFWNESEDRNYEQIGKEYLGSTKKLTQDECVQECFEFLEALSVDTRGFKADEVTFDEEKHSYSVKLQGYIEDIPTYEVADLCVTEFGLVYSYSGDFVGTVPYYEENPFDMSVVRPMIMKKAYDEIPPGATFDSGGKFDGVYDEVQIKILEYKFNSLPDKGIALEIWMSVDLIDNSGESPFPVWGSWAEIFWVTL